MTIFKLFEGWKCNLDIVFHMSSVLSVLEEGTCNVTIVSPYRNEKT